jgi:hypothetical protein
MGALYADPDSYLAERAVGLETKACLGLWAAVMYVAIEDSRGRGAVPTGLTREKRPVVMGEIRDRACAWMSSQEQTVGSFLWISRCSSSTRTRFLWICTLLDQLDPDHRAVRARRALDGRPPP